MSKLTAGKDPSKGEINVFVEIPEGTFVKYELDKETNLVTVDRFSFTTMAFPANYGFVPETMGEDGDPLDALVIATYSLHPGVVIPSRVIGMLEMEDEAGVDTKIIAVPTKKVDPFYAHIEDVKDLDEIVKQRIQHYFNHYKELEPGKWVKTKSFLSKQNALDAIKKALKK